MAVALQMRPEVALWSASERVLSAVTNRSTRAMYRKALSDLLSWCDKFQSPSLSARVVQNHISYLRKHGYSRSTINQRIVAIRKLARKAGEIGLLPLEEVVAIARLKGVKVSGAVRHSLTKDQCEALINIPDPRTMKGKRDRALLAVLLGCALRRSELLALEVEFLRQTAGGWFFNNVSGRGGRRRRVLVPPWVREALGVWITAAGITKGPIFRRLNTDGSVTDVRICGQTVLSTVTKYGHNIGLTVKPDDLRRACAKLCQLEGAGLEQIQLLLGHSTVQVTQEFLGVRPGGPTPANDMLGLKWRREKTLAS
jgi:site-specific recombinase XerD